MQTKNVFQSTNYDSRANGVASFRNKRHKQEEFTAYKSIKRAE